MKQQGHNVVTTCQLQQAYIPDGNAWTAPRNCTAVIHTQIALQEGLTHKFIKPRASITEGTALRSKTFSNQYRSRRRGHFLQVDRKSILPQLAKHLKIGRPGGLSNMGMCDMRVLVGDVEHLWLNQHSIQCKCQREWCSKA